MKTSQEQTQNLQTEFFAKFLRAFVSKELHKAKTEAQEKAFLKEYSEFYSNQVAEDGRTRAKSVMEKNMSTKKFFVEAARILETLLAKVNSKFDPNEQSDVSLHLLLFEFVVVHAYKFLPKENHPEVKLLEVSFSEKQTTLSFLCDCTELIKSNGEFLKLLSERHLILVYIYLWMERCLGALKNLVPFDQESKRNINGLFASLLQFLRLFQPFLPFHLSIFKEHQINPYKIGQQIFFCHKMIQVETGYAFLTSLSFNKSNLPQSQLMEMRMHLEATEFLSKQFRQVVLLMKREEESLESKVDLLTKSIKLSQFFFSVPIDADAFRQCVSLLIEGVSIDALKTHKELSRQMVYLIGTLEERSYTEVSFKDGGCVESFSLEDKRFEVDMMHPDFIQTIKNTQFFDVMVRIYSHLVGFNEEDSGVKEEKEKILIEILQKIQEAILKSGANCDYLQKFGILEKLVGSLSQSSLEISCYINQILKQAVHKLGTSLSNELRAYVGQLPKAKSDMVLLQMVRSINDLVKLVPSSLKMLIDSCVVETLTKILLSFLKKENDFEMSKETLDSMMLVLEVFLRGSLETMGPLNEMSLFNEMITCLPRLIRMENGFKSLLLCQVTQESNQEIRREKLMRLKSVFNGLPDSNVTNLSETESKCAKIWMEIGVGALVSVDSEINSFARREFQVYKYIAKLYAVSLSNPDELRSILAILKRHLIGSHKEIRYLERSLYFKRLIKEIFNFLRQIEAKSGQFDEVCNIFCPFSILSSSVREKMVIRKLKLLYFPQVISSLFGKIFQCFSAETQENLIRYVSTLSTKSDINSEALARTPLVEKLLKRFKETPNELILQLLRHFYLNFPTKPAVSLLIRSAIKAGTEEAARMLMDLVVQLFKSSKNQPMHCRFNKNFSILRAVRSIRIPKLNLPLISRHILPSFVGTCWLKIAHFPVCPFYLFHTFTEYKSARGGVYIENDKLVFSYTNSSSFLLSSPILTLSPELLGKWVHFSLCFAHNGLSVFINGIEACSRVSNIYSPALETESEETKRTPELPFAIGFGFATTLEHSEEKINPKELLYGDISIGSALLLAGESPKEEINKIYLSTQPRPVDQYSFLSNASTLNFNLATLENLEGFDLFSEINFEATANLKLLNYSPQTREFQLNCPLNAANRLCAYFDLYELKSIKGEDSLAMRKAVCDKVGWEVSKSPELFFFQNKINAGVFVSQVFLEFFDLDEKPESLPKFKPTSSFPSFASLLESSEAMADLFSEIFCPSIDSSIHLGLFRMLSSLLSSSNELVKQVSTEEYILGLLALQSRDQNEDLQRELAITMVKLAFIEVTSSVSASQYLLRDFSLLVTLLRNTSYNHEMLFFVLKFLKENFLAESSSFKNCNILALRQLGITKHFLTLVWSIHNEGIEALAFDIVFAVLKPQASLDYDFEGLSWLVDFYSALSTELPAVSGGEEALVRVVVHDLVYSLNLNPARISHLQKETLGMIHNIITLSSYSKSRSPPIPAYFFLIHLRASSDALLVDDDCSFYFVILENFLSLFQNHHFSRPQSISIANDLAFSLINACNFGRVYFFLLRYLTKIPLKNEDCPTFSSMMQFKVVMREKIAKLPSIRITEYCMLELSYVLFSRSISSAVQIIDFVWKHASNEELSSISSALGLETEKLEKILQQPENLKENKGNLEEEKGDFPPLETLEDFKKLIIQKFLVENDNFAGFQKEFLPKINCSIIGQSSKIFRVPNLIVLLNYLEMFLFLHDCFLNSVIAERVPAASISSESELKVYSQLVELFKIISDLSDKLHREMHQISEFIFHLKENALKILSKGIIVDAIIKREDNGFYLDGIIAEITRTIEASPNYRKFICKNFHSCFLDFLVEHPGLQLKHYFSQVVLKAFVWGFYSVLVVYEYEFIIQVTTIFVTYLKKVCFDKYGPGRQESQGFLKGILQALPIQKAAKKEEKEFLNVVHSLIKHLVVVGMQHLRSSSLASPVEPLLNLLIAERAVIFDSDFSNNSFIACMVLNLLSIKKLLSPASKEYEIEQVLKLLAFLIESDKTKFKSVVNSQGNKVFDNGFEKLIPLSKSFQVQTLLTSSRLEFENFLKKKERQINEMTNRLEKTSLELLKAISNFRSSKLPSLEAYLTTFFVDDPSKKQKDNQTRSSMGNLVSPVSSLNRNSQRSKMLQGGSKTTKTKSFEDYQWVFANWSEESQRQLSEEKLRKLVYREESGKVVSQNVVIHALKMLKELNLRLFYSKPFDSHKFDLNRPMELVNELSKSEEAHFFLELEKTYNHSMIRKKLVLKYKPKLLKSQFERKKHVGKKMEESEEDEEEGRLRKAREEEETNKMKVIDPIIMNALVKAKNKESMQGPPQLKKTKSIEEEELLALKEGLQEADGKLFDEVLSSSEEEEEEEKKEEPLQAKPNPEYGKRFSVSKQVPKPNDPFDRVMTASLNTWASEKGLRDHEVTAASNGSSLDLEEFMVIQEQSAKSLYNLKKYFFLEEEVFRVYNVLLVEQGNQSEAILLFGKSKFFIVKNTQVNKLFQALRADALEVEAKETSKWVLPKEQFDELYNLQKCSGPFDPASQKVHRYAYSSVVELFVRRYCLKPMALELFLGCQTSLFLVTNQDQTGDLFKELGAIVLRASGIKVSPEKIRCMNAKMYGAISTKDIRLFPNLRWTKKKYKRRFRKFSGQVSLKNHLKSAVTYWRHGLISNFEYLLFLNFISGRTYWDLSQYPVLPWVVGNYSDEELEFKSKENFRNLGRPIGAQTPEQTKKVQERYEASMENMEIAPYHFGSHYSNRGYTTYFMIRAFPFSRFAAELQSGQFDYPDRLFANLKETWALAQTHDNKELIPEFYFLPEFLMNTSQFNLGRTQLGIQLFDTGLPPWANCDPRQFVNTLRKAMEGEIVSKQISRWVDLTFGIRQTGKYAQEAFNSFFPLTYENSIRIEDLESRSDREAYFAQINEFGQTPKQLFRVFHPSREHAQPCQMLFYASEFITRLGYGTDTGLKSSVKQLDLLASASDVYHSGGGLLSKFSRKFFLQNQKASIQNKNQMFKGDPKLYEQIAFSAGVKGTCLIPNTGSHIISFKNSLGGFALVNKQFNSGFVIFPSKDSIGDYTEAIVDKSGKMMILGTKVGTIEVLRIRSGSGGPEIRNSEGMWLIESDVGSANKKEKLFAEEKSKEVFRKQEINQNGQMDFVKGLLTEEISPEAFEAQMAFGLSHLQTSRKSISGSLSSSLPSATTAPILKLGRLMESPEIGERKRTKLEKALKQEEWIVLKRLRHHSSSITAMQTCAGFHIAVIGDSSGSFTILDLCSLKVLHFVRTQHFYSQEIFDWLLGESPQASTRFKKNETETQPIIGVSISPESGNIAVLSKDYVSCYNINGFQFAIHKRQTSSCFSAVLITSVTDYSPRLSLFSRCIHCEYWTSRTLKSSRTIT